MYTLHGPLIKLYIRELYFIEKVSDLLREHNRNSCALRIISDGPSWANLMCSVRLSAER